MKGESDGFTLLELLVVVIIVGILAAIAVPAFLSQRERAYRAAVQTDLHHAAVAQEVYYTEAASYTSAVASLGASGFNGSRDVQLAAAIDVGGQAYCVAARHELLNTETWYRGSLGVLTRSAPATCGTVAPPVLP